MLKCLFSLHTHTGYTERAYEKEMNQRDSIRRFITICSLNRNSMCLDVTCNWLSVRCACAATTLTLATVNWVEMIQWWHTHMWIHTREVRFAVVKNRHFKVNQPTDLQIRTNNWPNELNHIWLRLKTKIDFLPPSCACMSMSVWICVNIN